MQRGRFASPSTPVDRLRQLDLRERFGAHGTEAWTIVYASTRDADDNIGDLDANREALAPSMRARAEWERAHSSDLDRLDVLDARIAVAERG
jgi:hypothetical protein